MANPAQIEPTFLDPYAPIVHLLERKFSIEELAALAHDVGIKMENVGGTTLLDMCRRLVEYAARRNKLIDLLTMAGTEEHRPPPEQWLELL